MVSITWDVMGIVWVKVLKTEMSLATKVFVVMAWAMDVAMDLKVETAEDRFNA